MAVPGDVTSVTLFPNATSIEFAWDALAAATAYRVKYREATKLNWALAGTPNGSAPHGHASQIGHRVRVPPARAECGR